MWNFFDLGSALHPRSKRWKKGAICFFVVVCLHLLVIDAGMQGIAPITLAHHQTMQLRWDSPPRPMHFRKEIAPDSVPSLSQFKAGVLSEYTQDALAPPVVPTAPPVEQGSGLNHAPPIEVAQATSSYAVPHYATVMAEPTELVLQVERAGLWGTGKLHWHHHQGQYELHVQADFDKENSTEKTRKKDTTLDWHSQGQIDGLGIAPQRYVSKGKGRQAQAANFQPENGLVSFSGTTASQAWVAASQDRLTWLLQLGAVLNGSPDQRKVGSQTVLWVVGTRGEADAWEFELQSYSPVQAYLVRKAKRLYDAEVQVWLNPQRQHLPMRMQMGYWGVRDSMQMVFE